MGAVRRKIGGPSSKASDQIARLFQSRYRALPIHANLDILLNRLPDEFRARNMLTLAQGSKLTLELCRDLDRECIHIVETRITADDDTS